MTVKCRYPNRLLLLLRMCMGMETSNTDSFWLILKKRLLSDKFFVALTVFVAVLSYGFAITNFSMGVDDPAAHHYLYTDGWGSMIQQGRLLHLLLNGLTGLIRFIPFFNDFLAVTLFVFSAWVLCALFQYITHGRLSPKSLALFSCIYLSYSIINEKFIYNLDVITTMISYLCFAFALLYSYQFVYEHRKIALLYAVLNILISISSYESFIFLYVGGVFFIFILKLLVNEDKVRFKELILKGLLFAAILTLAFVLYYSLVYALQMLTDQYGVFVRNSIWNSTEGHWRILKKTVKQILKDMLQFSYLPILIFDLFSAIGFFLFALFAVKRKSLVLFLCFGGMFASNFFIHLITGFVMYRAAQTFCFFVAAVALMFMFALERTNIRIVRNTAYALAAFLVLLQAADLNRWFYNDYSRYKKEEFAVNAIATRLVAECDVSKPVVFTNRDDASYLYSTDAGGQVNGRSMLMWGVGAFRDTQSPMLIEIFKLHGYTFIQTPTAEQVQEAKEKSKTMPAWPKKESIMEFEEYIVVNFSEAG